MMNNNYRKPTQERSQQEDSPKIDLGNRFPKTKEVKPEKEVCEKYGNHGPA